MTSTASILKENDKRLKELFCEYDPIKGIGSHIDRFPFYIYKDQKSPIYLPSSMQEYKGVNLEKDSGKNFQQEMMRFHSERLINDFEFWAFICAKIKPKKGGALISFKLNLPQRILLSILIEMFLDKVPIRVIIVKARQWGGSTLVQIFMVWIQLLHMTNWNSVIIGDVEDQSRNIRGMYSRLIENYPEVYGKYSLDSFEGSTKNKYIKERNNVISIGSMQKPESLRSQDLAMCHLSEVSFWKKTEGKSPEDLIQNIRGTISDEPLTLVAMESTAKGVGNYFHREWMRAIQGESDLSPVFIPWFKIENYATNFDSQEEKIKFIESLNDYEQKLWDHFGATLEGIKWYRNRFKAYGGDTWRMQSEFPSSHEEAFQATGRKVFAPAYVKSIKENLKSPILKGDIFGKSKEGKNAFINLEIKEVTNGDLSVWSMPNTPSLEDNEVFKGGRYAIFVDIGGRSTKADWSVISVFDRYWMAKGGEPERVATWVGHYDQDLLAWKAAQLAYIYNKALLAFEINTYNQGKDADTEGSHGLTIVDTLADYYDNMYTRSNPEDIRQGIPAKWGFHMNVQTKGMIIDNFNRLLRLNAEAGAGYIEYDERAYFEADYFEYKEDGKQTGAVEGQHDDILITTMGALWLCTSYMDAPLIIKKDHNRRTIKTIKSAASI